MNSTLKKFLLYIQKKIQKKLDSYNLENHNLEIIELYQKLGGQTFRNINIDLFQNNKISLLKDKKIFNLDFISKLENISKGINGESEVLNQIKLFNLPNSICLHNLYFANSDVTTKELDFVLITPYGIFLIESKYRSCNSVKFSGYDYYEDYYGKLNKQANPIFQILIQKNYLHELLDNKGYNIPIYEVLVFSGNVNIIKQRTLPMDVKHICKSNELYNLLITTCANLEKKLDYNRIKKISDFLQKQCIFPRDMFFPQKNDFVVPELHCLSKCCDLPMIPRFSYHNESFFLICPESKKEGKEWLHDTKSIDPKYFS